MEDRIGAGGLEGKDQKTGRASVQGQEKRKLQRSLQEGVAVEFGAVKKVGPSGVECRHIGGSGIWVQANDGCASSWPCLKCLLSNKHRIARMFLMRSTW